MNPEQFKQFEALYQNFFEDFGIAQERAEEHAAAHAEADAADAAAILAHAADEEAQAELALSVAAMDDFLNSIVKPTPPVPVP